MGIVPVIVGSSTVNESDISASSSAKIDPIARYGGYAVTAMGMPQDRGAAYLWAKNMGTLVAYETFLRKYSDGSDADSFGTKSAVSSYLRKQSGTMRGCCTPRWK